VTLVMSMENVSTKILLQWKNVYCGKPTENLLADYCWALSTESNKAHKRKATRKNILDIQQTLAKKLKAENIKAKKAKTKGVVKRKTNKPVTKGRRRG